MRPARIGRNPEHIFSEVCIRVFSILGIFGQQLLAFQFETIGNMLEKDQAKSDVLVVRRLHIAAQLVGGLEQAGFNAEVGAVVY